MPRTTPPAGSERLRTSPGFVQAVTLDGRPYIAQDVEPYTQFWLSERERLLLALFGRRGGATVDEAVAGYLRLAGLGAGAAKAERARVLRVIAGMLEAGALMRHADDTSRYDQRIVDDYVAHRPFPPEVAAHIAAMAGIGRGTRVLDLAGGPGDLALALAGHGGDVSLMDLSKGFLAAARRRARAAGLPLQTLHDSCNRLVHRDEPYDLITVSQALHWLDDVQVCRGVCRLLQPGGSFFVVHAAMDLPDAHPLAWLLGHDSVLGRKERQPFAAEVQPLLRRLALLFEALDAPEVQRVDPAHRHGGGAGQRIAPAGVALFSQQRPYGLGYARGFLTPRHIEITGRSTTDFWADVQARCAGAGADALLGTQHWAVLQFTRGAAGAMPVAADGAVQAIGYQGPAEG